MLGNSILPITPVSVLQLLFFNVHAQKLMVCGTSTAINRHFCNTTQSKAHVSRKVFHLFSILTPPDYNSLAIQFQPIYVAFILVTIKSLPAKNRSAHNYFHLVVDQICKNRIHGNLWVIEIKHRFYCKSNNYLWFPHGIYMYILRQFCNLFFIFHDFLISFPCFIFYTLSNLVQIPWLTQTFQVSNSRFPWFFL